MLDATTVEVPWPGPSIVKPRFGGSSIGVEIVADLNAARALMGGPHYRRGAIIEPYRAGAVDLEIAIRSHPETTLSAISRPERGAGAEIFDYRNKYQGAEGMASAPRECPAQLPADVEKTIRDSATVLARAAMVRGVARLDFLFDGNEVWVNEINTIPGSLAKHLWVEPDRPFVQQLNDLLAEAAGRPTYQPSSTGADSSILRSATSINSKLS